MNSTSFWSRSAYGLAFATCALGANAQILGSEPLFSSDYANTNSNPFE